MAVIGLVLGRLRSSYTLISRPSLSSVGRESSLVYLPEAKVMSRIISHSGIQSAHVPTQIIEAIHSCLGGAEAGAHISAFGMLDMAKGLSHRGDARGRDVELAKLQGIVEHELSKGSEISRFSIQDVRLALNIPRSSSRKLELMRLFTDSVLDRDECVVNTGIQQMSESWGVARLLEQSRLLIELRQYCPSLIAEMEKSMKKKLSQIKDDSVYQELMKQNIDLALKHRFSI